MALLKLILIGSAATASILTYQKRRQKPKLIQMLVKSASAGSVPFASENPADVAPPSAASLSFLTKLDDSLHTFMQAKVDPLVNGAARQQQMKILTIDEEIYSLSETEKGINRRIASAVLIAGTALLARWLFPPLLILSTAAAVYTCGNLYTRAYHSVVNERRVKIDLVAALYISGIWLAGYFIFGAIAIFMYFLGSKVIYQMENSSRRELGNIFGQQVRFVWCLVDGMEVQIPIEQLQADDIVIVNAGEPIPVDGVITEGMASIDQHVLTGEAQPVEKSVGAPVFAATLMLTGYAHIQVQKAGTETTAAQISSILEQTASYQTALESKGLELAHKSALPNLLMAGFAWPMLGFTSAVAVLNSGLGYNMRTVSLLSTLNYLQIASHRAILIKDGRALERLHQVETFVFDKTGTLTLEQPRVAQIHCLGQHFSEDDILTVAAAAEYRQPHPIAKAIIAAAEERHLTRPQIDEASYKVGYGIEVLIDHQLIRVGSERFMTLSEIFIPEEMRRLQATCQQKGHSLVMVARDDELIGALELHATVRPEVESVMNDLRQRGLKLAIISGDQEEPTRTLAHSLGIDSYFANTLPENKASIIEQLQNEGRVVCFIGDGINDAIALKQADVGISLLGATTIATDTAQIVLMDQSLAKLGDLLDLAANFDKTIRHAFWTTMIPGVICIGGVFFLHFGIVAAELLFQLGFFTGLGVAMKPLLDEQRKQRTSH